MWGKEMQCQGPQASYRAAPCTVGTVSSRSTTAALGCDPEKDEHHHAVEQAPQDEVRFQGLAVPGQPRKEGTHQIKTGLLSIPTTWCLLLQTQG